MNDSSSVSVSRMTPITQLNSRGALYAPWWKTRGMRKKTVSTMRWAVHRCMFRTRTERDRGLERLMSFDDVAVVGR